MLLSWGDDNSAGAQSFLRQRLRSEPNAAARELAEFEEWWDRCSEVSQLIAGRAGVREE